jgi:hypothetical protein
MESTVEPDKVLFEKSIDSGAKLVVLRSRKIDVSSSRVLSSFARGGKVAGVVNVRAQLQFTDASAAVIVWSAMLELGPGETHEAGLSILDAQFEANEIVIVALRDRQVFVFRGRSDEWGNHACSESVTLRASDWRGPAWDPPGQRDNVDAKLERSNSGLWELNITQHVTGQDVRSHLQQTKDRWQFKLTLRDGKPPITDFGPESIPGRK